MRCKDCDCWGGSNSIGDYRKCYHVDIYSKIPLDIKHKDDTCEWKRNMKFHKNEKK